MTRLDLKLFFIIILIIGLNNWTKAQDFIFKCDGIYQTKDNGIKIFVDKMSKSISPEDTITVNKKDKVNMEITEDFKTPDSYLVDTIPIICTNDFKIVRLDKDKRTNKPIFYIKLNDNVKDKFAKATEQNLSKSLLLIFDNRLITASNVVFPIESGELNINGLDEILIKRLIKKINK